ncbi:hypothetical protein OsJ_35727 [Oryza sativa Japonica Group]|uniref:Uncharacterized protein n=1 Tax=Oryza sativa subsp. japonica TaxID=39947 RepID=B9GCL2_ORYSJ|nr:hypothetical protein OsJ_35727 [Oryza sativa Japonica Group]
MSSKAILVHNTTTVDTYIFLDHQCQIRWQAIDLALRLSPVDLAAQSLASTEDSELARRLRGPAVAVGKRLSFMNEYLAEDRDPFRLLRSVQSRAKEDLAIHVSQRGCSSTICQIRWQAIDLALRLSPVDLAAQSLASTEDSELARRLRGPAVAVGKRLSFMNEYLAEDRDPFRCWVVTAAVAFVTFIDSEIPESAEADPEPECDYPQREGEHLSI